MRRPRHFSPRSRARSAVTRELSAVAARVEHAETFGGPGLKRQVFAPTAGASGCSTARVQHLAESRNLDEPPTQVRRAHDREVAASRENKTGATHAGAADRNARAVLVEGASGRWFAASDDFSLALACIPYRHRDAALELEG
jgi:hypothetical protein